MYCKECGSPLRESDTICQVCGAKVEKLVFDNQIKKDANGKKTELPKFQWNVDDFPKPKKTEDINFNWSINDTESAEAAEAFNYNKEKLIDGYDENIDKLFTFNKNNEEFQKILDKDFERIKNKHESTSGKPPMNREVFGNTHEETPEEPLYEEEIINSDNIHTFEASVEIEHDITDIKPEKNESENTEQPLWFEEQADDEKNGDPKKKNIIGRVLLVIIILILLVEGTMLGIKYFIPDSNAAAKVSNIQAGISATFIGWKDQAVDFFKNIGKKESSSDDLTEDPESENQDEEDNEISDSTPDPMPAADKQALVESQLAVNKNISTVRANENLVFDKDKDYGNEDINTSSPINNNIWEVLGSVKYYDQEIVKTLILFDSKWNDYVNGGSDDVLKLAKKDSRAYKNIATFSKVGKVKQTFEILEIGELRQGKDGFYAWTYEEIKEESGGKTNLKKYHWIYHLEPVDGEMKIVNYIKY